MPDAILEVQNIHTYIGQFYILQDVSVDVPKGEITVLLGRNGAGKTTTLKSIMGLTPPREGHILFEGKSLKGLRPYDIARLGIGYVPENRAIFKDLSVRENLEIAERHKGDLARHLDFIFEVFPDLKRLYAWPGGKLSGGQQQMLAVARVLVPENRLLLIDEPSEGLAPVIIEQLMHAIRKLSAQTTVLLVEQNFVVAQKLAGFYTIIEEGASVHAGKMDTLLQDQSLIRRYMGAELIGNRS